MTEVNWRLAAKILNIVVNEPEKHDQTVYGRVGPCGTTACVAGWAVLLSGGVPWDRYLNEQIENGQFAYVIDQLR